GCLVDAVEGDEDRGDELAHGGCLLRGVGSVVITSDPTGARSSWVGPTAPRPGSVIRRASSGVRGEQAARRALLVAALGLLQGVRQALDGEGLQDHPAVAFQGGQGQTFAAEDGVHHALAVEAADALDAVLDALLE